MIDDPNADQDELLDLSDKALRWQQAHDLDPSQQVALRAIVLRKADRGDEARALLDGYLAKPDAGAGAEVLGLLRTLRTELGGR